MGRERKKNMVLDSDKAMVTTTQQRQQQQQQG